MLSELSGKEHRVITAVVVGTAQRAECEVNASKVRFAPMPASQIASYVASGEPMGKAGAYAIQSQAATWIERISGSYSGIMGLPLYETALLLRRFGVRF
jgi:septum formation protein